MRMRMSNKDDEEEVTLPGFRFHPTDEELVGFYLKRKVEKKSISIELIKQIDIYKHDPWDLPKVGNMGEKEWYFFCLRGRKYRNSVRPNRVTGSGFWKATGIDKSIYDGVNGRECTIGLKKSLVYYRGSAGKGTKTDWMMHEFRLPPADKKNNAKNITQEAEVWTLCRIFKRDANKSHQRYMRDWKEASIKRNHTDSISQTSSLESNNKDSCVSFGDSIAQHSGDQRNLINNQLLFEDRLNSVAEDPSQSSFWSCLNGDELFRYGDWDELRHFVQLGELVVLDQSPLSFSLV